MATATEVKAPQTAAFTDGTVSVGPGDTVFLECDEATGIPANEYVTFYYDNAALDRIAFVLSGADQIKVCSGYANLIGKKLATTAKIGIGKFSS